MKNKFILAISSLFCAATFAVAQDAVTTPEEAAPVAEPEAVEAPAEQSAPAPEATPAVSAPAPTQTTEQPAQSNETSPVIFYYANTAPAQQAAVQPQPAQMAPAAAPQPVPVQTFQPTPRPKQTMHYGVQGSIGTSEFTGGSNDDMDEGLTWNAGAFINIPISDYIFSFELGSQFLYRKESNSFTQSNKSTYAKEARKDKIIAYSLGFPIQMNINASRAGIINFFIGTEIEIPLYNNLQISINGEKRVDEDLHDDHCAPMSWDFILGMGVNATSHFGIYTRMNIGISDIYDDLYIRDDGKDEYWSFRAFDLSIGLRLFL